MAVEIGRSNASFHENPIQLMSDCHRRIERFLYVVITVKRQAQGGPLNPEQKTALETALRYFRNAAPWHTLDEEESLFPRMRIHRHLHDSTGMDPLKGLELEHAVIQVCHQDLDELGSKWLKHSELNHREFQRFGEIITKLSVIYHRHIHEEESRIFPLAQKMLREPEIRAIGREMAERREVPFVPEMLANR